MKSDLINGYTQIDKSIEKVYVTPGVKKNNPNNNYLYLFYKCFFSDDPTIIIKLENLPSFKYHLLFIRKLKGEKSLIHHHWYQFTNIKSFIKLLYKTFWLVLYKMAGGRIVWTLHNKYPHEKKWLTLNKILRFLFARLADKLHVHCYSAIQIMSEVFNINKNKFFVVEHPTYPVKFLNKEDSITTLKEKYSLTDSLSQDSLIFLMFGQIADYKGILEVVQIFINLPNSYRLIIAGATKKNGEKYGQLVRSFSQKTTNVIFINRLIPGDDVHLFFASADYVLFNYKDILTSGGVVLALGYKKSIIAPNKGCLKELKDPNVFKFYDSAELESILLSASQNTNKS
ncbi:glycosyltransferase family 4 protein [bacterium]|nr:glycosyltransferase family 4 protein [bacterium]